MTKKKSHSFILTQLIAIFIVIPAIAMYFGVIRHHGPRLQDVKINGLVLNPSKDIEDFNLQDQNGAPFSKGNLRGRWSMMFFGFTNCASVCPTTLSALNKMYKSLEQQLPDNQLPQVVFVTIDADRDNTYRMRTYVHAFNPHFIGLRGDDKSTTALENQFHIVSVKMQGDTKADYYFDHSAEILLINPKGELQAYFSYPHNPEQLVNEYKEILRAS